MLEVASPAYGERNVILRYRVCDLLWRPARRLVRFVAVIHPTRGSCLLMCTDLSLSAVEIIRLYSLRFKIEHSFKQATRLRTKTTRFSQGASSTRSSDPDHSAAGGALAHDRLIENTQLCNPPVSPFPSTVIVKKP
jgi:hypothetical protein